MDAIVSAISPIATTPLSSPAPQLESTLVVRGEEENSLQNPIATVPFLPYILFLLRNLATGGATNVINSNSFIIMVFKTIFPCF